MLCTQITVCSVEEASGDDHHDAASEGNVCCCHLTGFVPNKRSRPMPSQTNVPVPWPSHTLWYCMPPKVPTIHVCWLRSLLSKKKVRRVREGVPLPLT